MSETKVYDLIIIGAGPAGLTASIYASRYKLKNLVIGKFPGGEVALSSDVENYPGFNSIKGIDLAKRFVDQAKSLGADFVAQHVVNIKELNEGFEIRTESGEKFQSRGAILASGTERRKLNIPGEKEYAGRGVSYCATCDGPFFKDRVVAVVGGGDSALTGAVILSDLAKKTYLIYRRKREDLRAEPIWVERFEERVSRGVAEFIFEKSPKEILGDGKKVTGISFEGEDRILGLDGVFIEIGSIPVTSLTGQLGVKTDEKGYIIVDGAQRTNHEGIWAAGDITTGSNRLEQIITSAAEGAIATASFYEWLRKKGAPKLWG